MDSIVRYHISLAQPLLGCTDWCVRRYLRGFLHCGMAGYLSGVCVLLLLLCCCVVRPPVAVCVCWYDWFVSLFGLSCCLVRRLYSDGRWCALPFFRVTASRGLAPPSVVLSLLSAPVTPRLSSPVLSSLSVSLCLLSFGRVICQLLCDCRRAVSSHCDCVSIVT